MSTSLAGYERYRKFMEKLAEENVDEYIDLPMIAVMGDTSSGKSSLLSNISLVELPSATDICTRCPIMLRMHQAKSRSASVKVHWKDRPEGKDVDFAEKTVGEENWNTLTDAIAGAQSHIIKKSGKEVARDVVIVDVRGPHCENLTLIDLPGIVRTQGKEESATLAEDILGLMNDYLVNPRCVILAVLPCNVDFHNSQIMAEARKVDPDTKRTIPVLTKPDLIDGGGEMSVKELLLGEKTQAFELGFHMIKGRGQNALNSNQSVEEGLQSEESFFSNAEPWRGVEDKNLFGTKNLRVKLAQLLMNLIRSSFRSIVNDMKAKYDDAMSDYQALGVIPSDHASKRATFQSIIQGIWKGIGAKALDGPSASLQGSSRMTPSAEFHEKSNSYQDTLASSKLATISDVFVGKDVIATISGKRVTGKVCFINDAKQVFLKNHVAQANTTDSCSSQCKAGKPGNVYEYINGYVYIKRDTGTVDRLQPIEGKLVRPDSDWIGDLIRRNRPYKLPIFINPNVFAGIVADHIEAEWKPPTLELLNFTSELMDRAAEEFIKEMKQVKSFPALEVFLIAKGSEVVEALKRHTMVKVEDFIKQEQVPYTQNHYLFENFSKQRSQRVKDEVLSAISGAYGNGTSSVSVNPQSLSSMIQNIFERNEKRSVDDHMSEEMQDALNSYGKVALKRFIDTVPMTCIEIMQKFADEMYDVLSKTTDEDIERLVSAPPDTVSKINKLKRKADILEKGIATIRELF